MDYVTYRRSISPLRCLIGPALTLSALLGTANLYAQEPSEVARAPQAEFSVLAGMATRSASNDGAINPDGIGYSPAMQLAFQGRGYVSSWLNFAAYYVRAWHEVNLPRGAAGIDYEQIDMGKVLTYSLGLRLEPGYQVSDQFRAWLSVGVGWGRMSMTQIFVTEAERSYTIRDRAGVFVETPFGLGASYEVFPRWLAVQAEANIAPLSKQTGKLFDTSPYVDDQGTLDSVGPMPTQTISSSFLLGVSLLL